MGPRCVHSTTFLIETVVALAGTPQDGRDMDAIPAEKVRGIDQQCIPFLGFHIEARKDRVGKGQSRVIG